MLQPTNFKHRKMFRAELEKKSLRNIKLEFGVYGLKSLEAGLLHSRELEAGRMVVKRAVKKRGQLWIRKFPDISITAKKSGVRMGKGKGNVVGWVCPVHAGEIIYELSGVPKKMAIEIFRVVGSKLSVKTKFVVLKS